MELSAAEQRENSLFYRRKNIMKFLKRSSMLRIKGFPLLQERGRMTPVKQLKKTDQAKKLGADGCLVVVPYYNHPTVEGCLRHFEEVSRVGLPTIVYHNPKRGCVRLSAKVLAKICEYPSIVAVKEASDSLEMVQELQQFSNISVLSGSDPFTYQSLEHGAVGSISVVANIIPRLWAEMINHFLQGNRTRAQEISALSAPLCKTLFLETNPQCVKYAASLLGKCLAYVRLPLLEPKKTTKLEIARVLAELYRSGLKN